MHFCEMSDGKFYGKNGKKQDGLHFIADLAESLKRDKQINIDNMLSTDDEER